MHAGSVRNSATHVSRTDLGLYVAGDDMVGENLDELVRVLWLEEVGDGAGGERGERLVGRGEDGEWTRAAQRRHEVGGLDRSDEGGKVWRGDGKVNDGLPPGRGRGRGLALLFHAGIATLAVRNVRLAASLADVATASIILAVVRRLQKGSHEQGYG